MSAVKGVVTVLVALVVLPFISVAVTSDVPSKVHPLLAIGRNTSSLAPYRNEVSLALTLTEVSWN